MNNTVQVIQSPAFARAYKKLHLNQKIAVNEAVDIICQSPECGEAKKGDLVGIYVYKFTAVNQLMLLAYRFDPKTRQLMLLGSHENFYRQLKQTR
ncbi:MAG: type II toxin-antitoxin system RelE/ParE family toxin [Proteobacteria bacterium]|nr:type II toxin-antitoxin system RelE/ParE family toxin [Pseudomonadota bacterium]